MPASVISRVEELATIDAQIDEDLAFEEQSPNPFLNYDDANPIKVDVDTGVDDEGEGIPDTGIVIAIPRVGMENITRVGMEDNAIPGVENAIPGVEEPPIETPGLDNLYVEVKV